MSQPVLVKVYGAFFHTPENMREEMAAILSRAIGVDQDGDCLHFSGATLSISFEGIWFPEDEMLELLEKYQKHGIEGKLDVLDIENWRMTRLQYDHGKLNSSSAPLNNVLDYSGF